MLKEKRNIIYLKKPVLIKEEKGIMKKRYVRLKTMKKKQLMKTMYARSQKILIDIQKYVSHSYLKTNNFLMK
jgi:hypothetical protein